MNYKKKALIYFIFLIFIFILVHFYMFIYQRYLQQSLGGINISLSEYTLRDIGSLFFNILLGVVFGIEYIVKEIKKNSSKWRINILKISIMGIPSLLLAIEPFHFLLLNNVLRHIGIGAYALIAPATQCFFGFFIGYIIITSFYKD